MQRDVLHHDFIIALGFRVGRQNRRVYPQHFFSINLDRRAFRPFLVFLRGTTFLFRGMVLCCLFGLDIRLALLPFELIVLITQALILFFKTTNVGAHIFNHIQQAAHQLAHLFVFNLSEINFS